MPNVCLLVLMPITLFLHGHYIERLDDSRVRIIIIIIYAIILDDMSLFLDTPFSNLF